MTAIDPDLWRPRLVMLAARNSAVEVTADAGSGDGAQMAPTFRMRLLTFGGDTMRLEKPSPAMAPEAGRWLREGAAVKVLVIDKSERWEFTTRIKGFVMHDLSDKVKVNAIEVAPPTQMNSGQRRSFFRVSTAGVAIKPARLTPIEVDAATAQATSAEPKFPAQPFTGRLLNIGGGGMGIEAPQRVSAQLSDPIRYRCRLELPTAGEVLEVTVLTVHLEPREGGTHYLGMRFEFDDQAQQRRCEQQVVRFTTWLQRQQIQRTKERAE